MLPHKTQPGQNFYWRQYSCLQRLKILFVWCVHVYCVVNYVAAVVISAPGVTLTHPWSPQYSDHCTTCYWPEPNTWFSPCPEISTELRHEEAGAINHDCYRCGNSVQCRSSAGLCLIIFPSPLTPLTHQSPAATCCQDWAMRNSGWEPSCSTVTVCSHCSLDHWSIRSSPSQ